MKKYQFSSTDVKLEIDNLQELIGMRCGNIHQISKDTLLIKFWKLGVSRHLLIENGFRFHLTEFPREKPKTPPSFCCQLRKYLRFRRLDDIIQPGNDRAVYFCFGELRLVLELFQAGNTLLINSTDNRILALYRYHVIQGTNIVGVNQQYMKDQFRDYTPPTDDAVHEGLANLEKKDMKVRSFLSSLYPFYKHEFFIHALIVAGYNPDVSTKDFIYNHDQVEKFLGEMHQFDQALCSKPPLRPPRPQYNEDDQQPPEEPPQPTTPIPIIPKPKGYVYSKSPKERYLCGFRLAQWDQKFVTEFPEFDKACDHFWSITELESVKKERAQAESVPERKVRGVQRNFEKKKSELQNELDSLNQVGELIMTNATEIEQCRQILNSLIGSQVRWDEIRQSIRAYQESGNPLANMIDKVEFEKSSFWCLIDDSEGNTQRVLIDLKKTAYANGKDYFNRRADIQDKLDRTIAQEDGVIKKVNKEAQASKKNVVMSIKERRKTWWFERFHWFITTENYLVIAGRDKIQNDVLYKHYLKKDDIYLHAEIHGAASVIIKNPSGRPVSELSLQQAAEFAVARSTAWKSNEPCQCFWVHANQVTKSLPGAQPAPTGSFYIIGEKNMFTMTMPQMGLGILFHVTEEHVKSHLEERRLRTVEEENPSSDQPPDVSEEPPVARADTGEIMQILPFHSGAEEEAKPDEEEEEEEDDGEIDDDELARLATQGVLRPEVAERRAARKAKRNRPKPKPKPLEEGVAEVMENEGIPVDLDVTGIEALTGSPHADDEFYAAYVMVAPLSAINTFKYKVKFTPGDTKKGKAWPLISNYFCSLKGMPQIEPGLIKLIPDDQVINQLPFNLRLQLGAGGTAMQNKKKGGKKNRGKKK